MMRKPAGFERPNARLLADGRRLHLSHGPIDLIIEADGAPAEVTRAYRQAREAFETILHDLVRELPLLRSGNANRPRGTVARRMHEATTPYRPEFITPMAAVAGSVADHVLANLIAGRVLSRAYVNNGGDIALRLNEGVFRVGICDDPVTGAAGGMILVRPDDEIGGVATSGWRGRSHSLGIADAVTVLAPNAAKADAAATMIANKVDLPGSLRIEREPARKLAPDSDLGTRLVTTGVENLTRAEIATALDNGETAATGYLERSLFKAAYLSLAGDRRTLSPASTITQNADHIREEPVCA
ncbi:hypothetical protein C8N35_10868 [Breoghania corrubedonensis]|uniref:Uncharacterized protein n=1 Tax=Breoghania corrubedonensis TaxID=665038 RepID=A0A2T5V5L2_9HYPH|nr:UPF0280 family protein [Breoghania corrubedonensis]PTW59033.1 hypothetical protein C8N35_10868 [Breoghania corrubedonensis]